MANLALVFSIALAASVAHAYVCQHCDGNMCCNIPSFVFLSRLLKPGTTNTFSPAFAAGTHTPGCPAVASATTRVATLPPIVSALDAEGSIQLEPILFQISEHLSQWKMHPRENH